MLKKLISQPLHWSHPHLIKPNELTAGILKSEYNNRLSKLSQLVSDGLVLLHGKGLQYKTKGIFYPYKQNTNFLYFSGIMNEPGLLLLYKSRRILFLQPVNEGNIVWDGYKIGLDNADMFNCTESKPIGELQIVLDTVLKDGGLTKVYTDLPVLHGAKDPGLLDGTFINPVSFILTRAFEFEYASNGPNRR